MASEEKRSWIARFRRDEAANTAVMFGLTLPLIVGAAGLGVETGYWYFKDRELQTAADLAAFAGTVEKRAGTDDAGVEVTTTAEATRHGFDAGTGTIQINLPPRSGNYRNERSVEVILTNLVPRMFSALYSQDPVVLHARGVATYEEGPQACILALDPEASGALTFTGNASATMNGCNVMSNSLADNSLVVSGSANITTPCAMTAGGADVNSGLNLTDCAATQTRMAPATDPFKNLVAPSVTGACKTMSTSNAAATMTPGRYCGGGNLKGTKTFTAGVYVIDGGSFKINANAVVAGSGVTFYLTNNATLDFNGNANITLSAPTSGTYSGMLFWTNKSSGGSWNKFNGNASSRLTGVIYAPSQDVEFLGNFSGNSGCMRVVAARVRFTGSTTMSSNCASAGIASVATPGKLALVE